MKRILWAAIVVLLSNSAGADSDLVNRLEDLAEKFRATSGQANQIHENLFLKEAPKLHADAMFAACDWPVRAIDPMPIIATVAELHEELFGSNDDELLRVVIGYLAFRTAYTVGYENALGLGFHAGLDRNRLCGYAFERARELQTR
jgi:hypothetical protein